MNNNSSDILTTQFHEFESSIIREEDWEVWEAIRFNLYYHLRERMMNFSVDNTLKASKSINYISALKIINKFILKCLKSRHKILIFAASRFKDSEGNSYDPNILDIYDLTKDNCFIIDSIGSVRTNRYDSIPDLLLPSICKFISIRKNHAIPQYIIDALNQKFNVSINASLFRLTIKNYYISKKFYNLLFKFLKPKGIFITQNNIQKGLFWAAKNNKIPLIEFQHGIIYFSHLAYSYPQELFDRILIPDYFFLFSDFWRKKIKKCFPQNHCFISGNTASSEIKMHPIKYDLTFISASEYIGIFISFVEEIRRLGYNGKICMKLHPNEYSHVKSVKERFENDSMVDVVYNAISIKDIIGMSNALFTIQSTSVYEALDAGKIVYLLKANSYEVHTDVFDNPKIRLIDSAEDLISKLNTNTDDIIASNNNIIYFEKFRKEEVSNLLRKIGII